MSLANGVLQLADVRLDDAGSYRCRAVGLVRERLSAVCRLNVVQQGELGTEGGLIITDPVTDFCT